MYVKGMNIFGLVAQKIRKNALQEQKSILNNVKQEKNEKNEKNVKDARKKPIRNNYFRPDINF